VAERIRRASSKRFYAGSTPAGCTKFEDTMELKLLRNEEDFKDHMDTLDSDGHILASQVGYRHDHRGTPEKYPCMVYSNFWDNPDGPYTYDHDFIYLDDVMSLIKISYKKLADDHIDAAIFFDGR